MNDYLDKLMMVFLHTILVLIITISGYMIYSLCFNTEEINPVSKELSIMNKSIKELINHIKQQETK